MMFCVFPIPYDRGHVSRVSFHRICNPEFSIRFAIKRLQISSRFAFTFKGALLFERLAGRPYSACLCCEGKTHLGTDAFGSANLKHNRSSAIHITILRRGARLKTQNAPFSRKNDLVET